MSGPYMQEVLRAAVACEASDVHFKTGYVPMFRINGRLVSSGIRQVGKEDGRNALISLMTERDKEHLNKHHEVDFSFVIPELARYRINVYMEKDHGLGAAIRLIPLQAPSLDALNLPPVVQKLGDERQGLLLVTGPTGSGKSTTLAALVDYINRTKDRHVVTIEDPLEFVHNSKTSIITQREVGTHVETFLLGLRAAMRQDPDVIMIGEMRDRETIWTALQACETGHLVFSTFHTTDAVGTINRLINSFEPHMHEQIRHIIAANLRGILSQRVLPMEDATGRVLAIEILVNTATVSDYIRKNDMLKINELINSGSYDGMQTMNQSLYMLYRMQFISGSTAVSYSNDPAELQQIMSGAYHGTGMITESSRRWTPYSAMGPARLRLTQGQPVQAPAPAPDTPVLVAPHPAPAPAHTVAVPVRPPPPPPPGPAPRPVTQPTAPFAQPPAPPLAPRPVPGVTFAAEGFSYDMDLPGGPQQPKGEDDVDIRISLD